MHIRMQSLSYVDDVFVRPEVAQELHFAQNALGVCEVVKDVGDLLDRDLAPAQLDGACPP